jgi:SnoaL-like domain
VEVEENKAAIRRFFSWEVFFGPVESLAVVDQVFDSEVDWLAPGNGEVIFSGTGAIKEELRRYREVGGEIAILEQIAEGESVATRYRLEVGEGEQRRAFAGVTLSHFADDGKIHEYRIVVTDDPDDLVEKMGNGHN